MSRLPEQFREDRALRDAAKSVLMTDIEHARTSLTPKGFADRVGGRIGDGAKDVYSVAKGHADDNRGIIAALIGAILLWISRDTIFEILGLEKAYLHADSQSEVDEGAETVPPPDDEATLEPEADPHTPPNELPDGDDDEQ